MRLDFCHWCDEHPHDVTYRMVFGAPAVSLRVTEDGTPVRTLHLTQVEQPTFIVNEPVQSLDGGTP